jgi:hypothetical protein
MKTGNNKALSGGRATLKRREDLRDIGLAEQRLKKLAKTHSADEVKRELGLKG